MLDKPLLNNLYGRWHSPLSINSRQVVHSGLPPVPLRLYLDSIFLPSVQFEHLWCMVLLTECQGSSKAILHFLFLKILKPLRILAGSSRDNQGGKSGSGAGVGPPRCVFSR